MEVQVLSSAPYLVAFPIVPALTVAFLFAHRRAPVSLLALPPRPYLPAMLAAIAVPHVSRPKAPLASLEQTPPGTGPARRQFPPAGLLIFGMACRTLGKAHGRSLLPEALPWRGRQSSPGRSRSYGQYETNNSIAKIGCSPARFPFSPPAAARRAPSGCCTGERRGVCGQGAGVTMTLPGKRKQALQGCNHCRGITWRAHRDDDRSAETRASALCKNTHRIGRPLCLENPRPKGGMLFHGATPPSLHSPPPSIRGVVPTGPPKWPPPPPPPPLTG